MFPLFWPLVGLGALKTGLDINNANKQNTINEAETRYASFTGRDGKPKQVSADIAGPLMQAAMMGGMIDAQAAHTAVNPGGAYSPYNTPQAMAAFQGGAGPVNYDPYAKLWAGPYGQ